MALKIRMAKKTDVDEIISLFESTVRELNSKDYGPNEIEAWASCSSNKNVWIRNITEQVFLLVEVKGKIVGFSSITSDVI